MAEIQISNHCVHYGMRSMGTAKHKKTAQRGDDEGMPAYKIYRDVQLKDCDPTGIVFLPRYFEMIHEVIEAWFDEALDWPMAQVLGSRGMAVPFRKVAAEFPVPARLGQRLVWRLSVLHLGDTSLDLKLEAQSTDGGEPYCTATGTLVLTEMGVLRPRSWSDALRARFAEYRVPAPSP